jgi:hypothetical protein
MSMTVYPVIGESLTLTASDQKNASGIAAGESAGMPDGTLGGAVEVSQDREVTKAGATRVMIKVGLKTPLTDPYNAQGNQTVTMGNLSAHCVITVPKVVADVLAFEAATAGAQGLRAASALQWIVRALTALVNDASLPAIEGSTFDSPVVKSIVSGLPLNVDSGVYGTAE